jgi:hypothetical protein
VTEQPICPRCDVPIPDTAYVCKRCADVLAVALRNAAANWEELEAAIARQTALAGSGGTPSGAKRVLHGPTDIPCFHDSCLSVRKSQLRAMWTAESPIPGEKSLVSLGALEDGWIVTNTATTWARLVVEESGRPIPPPTPPAPKRADPKRVTVSRPKPLEVLHSPSPTLCDYSWLPVEFCGCGHAHPEKERA